LTKIIEKTGSYDIIFLIGKVFDKEKNFSEISKLEKINTKFIIFDSSEIGAFLKHTFSSPYNFSDNITFLDRKGVITIHDIKIAYLSGFEEEKYLLENYSNSAFDFTKAIYCGNAFNKEDVNSLIKLREETEKDSKIDIFLSHCVPNINFQELVNSTDSPIFASLNKLNAENSNSKKISTKEALEKHSSYSCSLVAKILAPRYHVTSMDDFFYEKLNYFSLQGKSRILSRFINLAYVKLLKYFFIRYCFINLFLTKNLFFIILNILNLIKNNIFIQQN